MTSARESLSSRSLMRASIHPWRSLAAWYSAFSLRSPCSRATPISRLIFGRSTSFRFLSSSLSRAFPSGVMGTVIHGRVLPHPRAVRPAFMRRPLDVWLPSPPPWMRPRLVSVGWLAPAQRARLAPDRAPTATLRFPKDRASSSSALRTPSPRLAVLVLVSVLGALAACGASSDTARGALHYTEDAQARLRQGHGRLQQS